MPNSCISITKIILICSLIFLASCSSISQSTFSEKRFEGKLSITQNKTTSNFVVKIKAFPEDVIIQIGKPLFGNMIKIKFNALKGLSFDPEINDQYLAFYQNYNTQDYLYFFDSCFNNLNPNQNIFTLNKNGTELKCEYKDKNFFLISFVSGEELYINGVLKHE